ncbi:MAG: chitobiase/beta-hexosaminidase C-terminal domain-containing protein, partial [Muribaculaceae bacterium]|nr:chitobiase/beta-hexosaminidase C-terminal domain-containing protein [Muribaculaceae bacterium]
GWDHGDTGYFSQGGFDSMINFAFNGTEGGTGKTPTTGDWEYYANFCNGNSGKQVLNYVSSHDTGLHRPGDQKAVGTMLLLCPGGAQIYYGDETSRPAVDGKGDPGMVTRGDFNWNAVDNDVNKHWQKVGQFRRRNAAVGAGSQINLGQDTYGRKFSENGYENAVVIRLNTQAGQSYTVNVNGVFNDGQRVMDGYDISKTATVSGGKVTMTASGPVMLIEEYGTIGNYVPPIPPIPTPTKPVVTASPDGGTFSNSVTVSLSVSPATDIYYTLDGSTPSQSSTLYTAPLTFTETTTLKTFAANDSGSDIKTFTYTKSNVIDPIEPDKNYVYFVNDKNWDVKVWAWDGDVNCTASGNWPGDAMSEKNGVLYWEAPSGKKPTQIIFSNNGGEKAGGGDLEYVNGHTYKSDGSHSLVSYGPQKPVISASPDGGTFSNSVSVALSVSPATDIYYTLDGTTPSQSSTRYSSPLTFTETTTLKAYAANEAGSEVKTFTYTKQQGGNDDPVEDGVFIYFDDTSKQNVTVWAWDGNVNCTASGEWPGDAMTKKNGKYYWALPAGKTTPTKIIISWGNHGENSGERAGESDLEFVNKHTYKADGSHSLVSYGPQKPVITVSPDGGDVRGTGSITVTIENDATTITGSFNNRTLTLGNGSTSLNVSDYLGENQSGTLSITATNSLGTATYSGTFRRDDSQPVYTLTGDWRELSIYQIMVGSFQHGDGGASGYSDMWGPEGHRKNGNLRGIINSLDYIKELGMNAIWMTPVSYTNLTLPTNSLV